MASAVPVKRTRFDLPSGDPSRERPLSSSSPSRSSFKSSPSLSPRSPAAAEDDGQRGLSAALRRCASDVVSGCLDAMAILTAANTFVRSPQIKVRTAHCLILNGIIFVGSIYLYDLAVIPFMRFLWSLPTGGDAPRFSGLFESFLVGIYYVLWVYPIYAFSFILNSWWHQEIADAAYKDQIGAPSVSPATYGQVRQRVADEIFRAIMVLIYLVQAAAVRFIPIIGTMLSFAFIAWIYSFYSFEYKWQNKGWGLAQRVALFETHWAYFFGFGLPCTLLTFFSPQFISGGVFAMIFPLFIVMANKATVLPTAAVPSSSRILGSILPSRMPIFSASWKLTGLVVRRVNARSTTEK